MDRPAITAEVEAQVGHGLDRHTRRVGVLAAEEDRGRRHGRSGDPPLVFRRHGLDEATAAYALSVLIVGNVVLQYPIGWLADRFPRRWVMLACAGLTVLGAILAVVYANIWATSVGRPTSIVVLPAIILLVSGSIGFQGLADVAAGETTAGLQQFVQMFVVAILVAAGVICAETDEDAEELAAGVKLWRQRGLQGPIPSPQAVRDDVPGPLSVAPSRKPMIQGDPATVAAAVTAMTERYGADEFMAVTITWDHDARVRSYELLAGELLG